MSKDVGGEFSSILDYAVDAEMKYIRRIGSSANLVCVCGNLGAYEALLYIIKNRENGSPVYDILKNVPSNFSGPAGINNRLKFFRELGILEVRDGKKKSQTCLVPSEKILNELGPILRDRYQFNFLG